MRTQAEIIDRVVAIQKAVSDTPGDAVVSAPHTDFMFGRRSTLLSYLPWPTVSELMGVATLPEYAPNLTEWVPRGQARVRADICTHLPVALECAYNHRAFGAMRSVEMLTEWAWLAGWDDVLAYAERPENVPQFGMPIVYRVMVVMQWQPPALETPGAHVTREAWFDRMRQGYVCRVGCSLGCQTPRVWPDAIPGTPRFDEQGRVQYGD